MARVRSSARRYAEAAFQLAERDYALDTWRNELDRISAIVEDEEVARALQNPGVPFERRQEAVDRAIGVNVPAPVRNLVLLLLRRNNVELLPRVASEFRRLVNRRLGITTGVVTSAAPLDSDEADAIRRRLEEMSGGRVELSYHVDAGLLGGIVVRIGDRLMDGSVRGRLERLRSRLASEGLS